jgi:hypothetical protein
MLQTGPVLLRIGISGGGLLWPCCLKCRLSSVAECLLVGKLSSMDLVN